MGVTNGVNPLLDVPFGAGNKRNPREGKACRLTQQAKGVAEKCDWSQNQQPVQFVVDDQFGGFPQFSENPNHAVGISGTIINAGQGR